MFNRNQTRGTIYLVVGVAIFLFAAGTLLFRIAFAIFGISLINQGLRLKGLPPIQFAIMSLFNSF